MSQATREVLFLTAMVLGCGFFCVQLEAFLLTAELFLLTVDNFKLYTYLQVELFCLQF